MSEHTETRAPVSATGRRSIARAFNGLVLVSVLAFAVYLYENELLYFPAPRRYDLLVASFLLLVVGHVLGTLSWWRVLKLDFDDIPMPVTLAGSALSNLGKYLPGKLWVVAGKAAYVADKTGNSLVRLATCSTRSQLVTVWVGISIGLLGAVVIGGSTMAVLAILGLSLAFLLLIVTGALERSSSKIHGLFTRNAVSVEHLGFGRLTKVLPFFLPGPLVRMIGFYVLAASLVGAVPWPLIFVFPFATALGMVAVFAPGGIGVREAVLVAAMVHLNMPLDDATTIAVAARIWAVAGDVAFFAIGLLVDRSLSSRPR